VIVFCIEPVGTFTACTTNVMPKRAMMAVTTSDSKYSRHTLRGGPGCTGFTSAFDAAATGTVVFSTPARGALFPVWPPGVSTGGSSIIVERKSLLIKFIVDNRVKAVKPSIDYQSIFQTAV